MLTAMFLNDKHYPTSRFTAAARALPEQPR
jgi:hypothetical protein